MTTPSADADRPDADAVADATAEGIRVRNAALVRLGAVPVVVIGALLAVVWSLVDGWAGFLGALIGLLLVAAFYGSDIVLMRKTARMDPIAVFAVMAMAFTFKLTLLAVFLVVLKDTTAFSVAAFATTVIALTSVGLFVAVWLSVKTTTVLDPAAGDERESGA